MGRLFVSCGRWLGRVALCLVLLGAIGLDFEEMTEGEVPFFNDEGSLSLPNLSGEAFEESMPELKLFNPKIARQAPSLRSPHAP